MLSKSPGERISKRKDRVDSLGLSIIFLYDKDNKIQNV
jgi:hypothetical protein